ncbi:YwhD family protein [Alicyclobacillus ferrooxydans]|uniref:YwhD family protein n=1 Tax=Alicyclobacillus ferrooxydans TaxID=471514 RepID=A0A0N8PPS6_9BACL|nr:YwhD family protein [Alicyclobacillus ferrooxydans]KPV45149.1 hypothetical protein AN477_04000 [Alicyclobacillus ferrooxydans]
MEKLKLTGKSNHSTDDAMKGLSAVFIDGDRVYIDNGAIHGKSHLEQGMQWVKTKEEVPTPREIWVVWVTLKRNSDMKQGYHGVMPFQLWIDQQAKVGYKSLADQVNKMDKAVKGQIDVTNVPGEVLEKLTRFLKGVRDDLWEQAWPTFKDIFGEPQG